MEDSEHAVLKTSLSTVPAKALNYSCRTILSRNLDVKQPLRSKSGYCRDYRGFAELMGFQYMDSKNFERHEDPTMEILEAWETHPNAVLGKLIEFLEKMDRYDVLNELIPMLEKDAEKFRKNQKVQNISIDLSEYKTDQANAWNLPLHHSPSETASYPVGSSIESDLLTCDDLRTGECTTYDAYVCYADEDSGFVKNLAAYLESPQIGLKLFIRGRDMLAGTPELDTNIELIKNRCRRMLIILTEHFIHSPHCAFQISFATSLSIEQKERILLPILIMPCDVPSILLRVSKIDFTKPDIYEWMWEKLIMSLLPESQKTTISPLEKFPAQPYAAEPIISDKSPVITFPETIKLSALLTDKSPARIASVNNSNEHQFVVAENSPSKDPLSQKYNVQIDSSNIEGIISNNKSPVVTVPETIQLPAQPAGRSAAGVESIKVSPKSSHVVSGKIPRKDPLVQKVKNAFSSYFRKAQSPSNSSSYLSGATSGFHSESTVLDNY